MNTDNRSSSSSIEARMRATLSIQMSLLEIRKWDNRCGITFLKDERHPKNPPHADGKHKDAATDQGNIAHAKHREPSLIRQKRQARVRARRLPCRIYGTECARHADHWHPTRIRHNHYSIQH